MNIQIPSSLNLRFLLLLPYLLLLIAGLTVPSDGNHGILSIKSLAFIGSVFSLSLYLYIQNSISWNQSKLLLFLLSSLTCLLFWFEWNDMNDELSKSAAFDQFKIFSLTLGMIALSLYVVEQKLLSYTSFVRNILYFNFAFSVFKVGLVALYLIGFIQINDFLQMLGIQYMSMGIIGNLSRLQTSMDIATPFLILFMLQQDKLGLKLNKPFKIAYLTFSTLSIFLSFSRYLFLIGLCSLMFYWCTLSVRKMVPRLFLTFLVVTAGLTWIGWDKVYQAIEMRFFSEATSDSDLVRVEQIRALMKEFDKQPYFGKGLGAFSPDVIRDTNNPHSYEVQWVAFLMQFGIVGISLILIPVAIVALNYLKPPIDRIKLSFLFLFCLWLLSGFTNPFLISLASGIIYSLFALTAKQLVCQPSITKADAVFFGT